MTAKCSLRASVLGAASFLAASAGFPAIAQADVLETFDQAGFSAGPAPYGTVTFTQDGTGLDVKMVLSDAFDIHNNMTSFVFNLSGDPALTVANLMVTTDGTTFVSPSTVGATFTTNTGSGLSIHQDGAGNFDYGVECSNCGPQSGGVDIQGISFTITAAIALSATLGSTAGTIGKDGNANFSSASVFQDSNTGNTGAVWASTAVNVPGPVVGAGLPGIVMACGSLLALARRRRQKIA
jgi:hypothetical protein